MFKLIQIKVVNFYLYESRQVDVDTITGIFGANGSGKSSLLDAVQTVMFGGNFSRGSGAVYNAQADEGNSNTRTLRSYCLGELDQSGRSRVRDEATTYITLTFLDDETKDMVSAGMCISASVSKPEHEILGRYLVPFDLTLQDHLEIVDGEAFPRDWSTFRQQLVRRPLIMAAPEEDVLYSDGGKFLNAILFRLRGKKSLPRADAFRQAFRFALRMKFDQTVDEIIRRQVLESRPTKTKAFLEMLRGFKNLASKVAEVEHKLGEAHKLKAHFERATSEERKSITWKAVSLQAAHELANARVTSAEYDEGNAASAREHAEAAKAAAISKRDELQQTASAASTARDQHKAHGESIHLNESITGGKRRVAQQIAEIRATLEGLQRVLGTPVVGKTVPDCDEKLSVARRAIKSFIDRDRLDDADELTAVVNQGCRAAKALNSEMFKALMDVGARIRTLTGEQTEAEENQRRIADGKPPLDTLVTSLQRRLEEVGIRSTPICDVLKVTDVDWQPVIEAQLGRFNVQALLVEKRDEREAFNLYRSTNIYGVKIVRSSTVRDIGPLTPGWVAELVTGSDQRAISFAHKHLRFMRAETADDCMRHSFALTADGMRVADGDLDRIQPVSPTMLKIGPDMSRMRDVVAIQLREVTRKLAACEQEESQLKKNMELLSIYVGDETEKAAAMERLSHALSVERTTVANFERRLADMDTTEYQRLVDEAARAADVAN